MSATMLHPHPHAVKHGRYVAPTPEAQAAAAVEFERQLGRNLYRRGKPVGECTTDEMKAGWIAASAAGEDAYYRCMMAQAAN